MGFSADRVFAVTAIEREGQRISFDQPVYRLLDNLRAGTGNKPANTGFIMMFSNP